VSEDGTLQLKEDLLGLKERAKLLQEQASASMALLQERTGATIAQSKKLIATSQVLIEQSRDVLRVSSAADNVRFNSLCRCQHFKREHHQYRHRNTGYTYGWGRCLTPTCACSKFKVRVALSHPGRKRGPTKRRKTKSAKIR
jgi:hypothetical protein